MDRIVLTRRSWPAIVLLVFAVIFAAASIFFAVSEDAASTAATVRQSSVRLLAEYWYVGLALAVLMFVGAFLYQAVLPKRIEVDASTITVDGTGYPLSQAEFKVRLSTIEVSGLGRRRFGISGAVYGKEGYAQLRSMVGER